MGPPADPESRFREAVRLQRQGDLEAAAQAYADVAARQPDRFEAHANLGVVLWRLGRPESALGRLDSALRLAPEQPELHVLRGVVLRALRHPGEAVESYKRALALRPDDADALNKLGNALRDLARPQEGLAAFERALALAPDAATLHNNRAGALADLGRMDEALAAHDRAVALQPDFAEAHNDRGLALAALGRLDAAVAAYDRALAARPDFPEAWNNRGAALRQLRRLDEAIDAFDRALALRPGYAEAAANRSYSRLALGRYAEGWADYEARWAVADFRAESASHVTPELRARLRPDLSVADLAGRDVLVVGEQGIGDVVMFASCLPDLLAIAGSVRLRVDERLAGLFAHSFPQATPLARDAPTGDGPVVAIGSLGRLFRSHAGAFPGIPYLSPPPDARARWAGRLGAREGRRIGIAWQGGTAKTGRAARSLPLLDLAASLAATGAELVSLQHGDVADELAASDARLPRPIRRFPPEELRDFADLAALMSELDLVVSVQGAAVHLAGALGAPCLALLPFAAEWRYLAEGEAMPWYRSVRLIRQPAPGAWGPVLAEAAARAAA
jgi:tetratricopeptide (TPR) repeat protein